MKETKRVKQTWKRVVTMIVALVLVVSSLLVWLCANQKYFVFGKVVSVKLVSEVDGKHIETTEQEAIKVLKSCLRKARKNCQGRNVNIEVAPAIVAIEFQFATGKHICYEYEIYHSIEQANPFGEFYSLFPEQNVEAFTMDAYSYYWADGNKRERVYSAIGEYTQSTPEDSGNYNIVGKDIELYNRLAEIDGAVPYILKYVLEESKSSKGALLVAIANKLLEKDIVVDDAELPENFVCEYMEGTPKYYAARRVAAENK